jgi:hypothetical protein
MPRELTFWFTDEERRESSVKVQFSRKFSLDDRKLRYRETNMYKKLTLHAGQRKLLLSEIEFLTLHGSKSKLIIYPGAAPGTHIIYLTRLFPNHRLLLYDTRPFDPRLKKVRSVRCVNQLFTDETALLLRKQYYSSCGYLLISDIRSSSPAAAVTDDLILDDLKQQQKWVQIMQPKMSLLKFRLPYNSANSLTYFAGEIYYQIWGPLSTTETRLMTDGSQETTYHTKDYEEIMYRFNNITRQETYSHDIPLHAVPGLDYCYDCYAEIQVLKLYLETQLPKSVPTLMNEITRVCKKPLNKDHHGVIVDPSKTVQERLAMI